MLFVVTFAKIIFYFLFLFILVYLIYTLHNNQILTYFNNLETPWLCSVILYVILQIIYTSELTLFFLLIEVYSITTYILISLRMDSLITTEAGLKFFIVNSFSSIIILFGLFQLYYWLATLNMFEMLLLMQY
jgi:NADH-quinone oxidoreductase subunit N